MITFELNYNNWPLWDKEMWIMEYVVRSVRAYLMDQWNAKGYLYLENIYEQFDLKWDPSKENVLYGADHRPEITYETNTVCNSITVKIR